jgi:RHS repeat-associated protein
LGSACLELDANANIISYEEYHPFGTTSYRAGRSYAETSQKRYKYCGKERDEETGLYYYGARYYAGWLCRWVSTEPLQSEYLNLSPYNYCANNPVIYIDPDGREIVIPTSLKGSERRQIMRNLGKLTNDKLSYDKSTGQVTISKQRTGSKVKGTELISRVINSSNTMTITVGTPGSGNFETDVNSANAINGVGTDVNVSFDPTSNPNILTVNSKTGNVSGKKRPNQIGLGHEIIHGERSMRGEAIDYSDMGTHTYQDANGNTVTQTVPKEELGTVGLKHNTSKDITENDLRKEQSKTKNKQRGAY